MTRLLYGLAAAILIIVAILSIIPLIYSEANAIYQNEYFVNILHIILSLAVTLVTFGLLKDSTATTTWGSGIQLGGSAAGFVAFYLIISSGLSPYQNKLIVLNDANGKRLSGQHFNVRLNVTEYAQILKTENGEVRPNIARSIRDFEIAITSDQGGQWIINDVRPQSCKVERDGELFLSNTCGDRIAITLGHEACLATMRFSTELTGSWTLGGLLRRVERVAGAFLEKPVAVVSSDNFDNYKISGGGALRDQPVDVAAHGHPPSEIPILDHLEFVRAAFNANPELPDISIDVSCREIRIDLAR